MELQRKKVDEKKREILVDKTSGLTENYDDIIATLSENICRYAIHNYDFVTSGTNLFKDATSKVRCRKELEGIHYKIYATHPTEMDLEVIKERRN
ncbi:hypothetical protein G4B88_014290 [Cannabis sativa]|uniref:Uncharacterized protein n=1 Tax=Cannabis sativa TaxID=3483 RepID=A0A7J6I8B6_CANSA|nr:hypothetical protein G4B88_014290 [Cannabis sativa]